MALNFNEMPDSVGPNLDKGMATLRIKEVTKTVSENKGSHMLVFKLEVTSQENKKLTDYCALYDEDKNPIMFGMVKLKKIMKVTGTIPEGDFTMKLAASLLEEKSFRAELVEDEYRGKIQIKLGYPETFKPVDLEEETKPKEDLNEVQEAASAVASEATVENPADDIEEEDDDAEL